MTLETAQLFLLGTFFVAFFVGTVLGFGTTIITITLAAQLLTIEEILPVIAPLNISLSIYLAVRHRKKILVPELLKRILPAVTVGVPVGLALFNLEDKEWLKIGFGVFVVVIAGLQLRTAWSKTKTDKPLGRYSSVGLLALGGMMHGLFNTGGPLFVYVLGREIEDKGEFRSTIAAMFTLLTIVLLINYWMVGLVTVDTMKLTALAYIPVGMGLFLGEIAHRKLDARQFKLALWVALLFGGVVLTVRAVTA